MRQARAEQVALVVDEHLRLVLEAAKRSRVNDTVAVALEIGASLRRRLDMPTPAGTLRICGVGRENAINRAQR